MGYGRAKFETFRCINCQREEKVLYWAFEDPSDARNSKTPSCSCHRPHMTYVPDPRRSVPQAVREGQRAVIYVNPNDPTDWQQAPSNDSSDPQAQRFAREGYVRQEFASIRDMRRFAEVNGGSVYGGKGYNDVLDYDEASRRNGDGRDVELMRARDRVLQQAYEQMRGNAGRYERAQEALRRKRGR